MRPLQVRRRAAVHPPSIPPSRRRGARLSRGLRRCADQGRLARGADPAGIRRLRPGPDRGERDHGGDQPQRRQFRRLPRPDVQHGHAAAARLRGAEARYLPKIASGELRLQSMGVTEPTTGTDTTKIKTTAVKKGDRYVVNGQKVWISRVQHSDLMILLARTTPLAEEVKKKSEGMSIFLVDLREAIGNGLTCGRSATWSTTRPTSCSSTTWSPGREPDRRGGQGLPLHPRRLNAERTLIAAECIGDGYWFIDKVTPTPRSASCSAGRSARTRACSFRSPRPTSRSRPPT
jgi:hypothetical protein